MYLSDRDLGTFLDRQWIQVTPLNRNDIQAGSIDLHLSSLFIVFTNHEEAYIDPQKKQNIAHRVSQENFMLHPGEFILGATQELVEITGGTVYEPDAPLMHTMARGLEARVEGKSSLGRIGLQVHVTAGLIDAGFCGNITLELINVHRLPILLRAGMGICQISFALLSSPPLRPYGTPGLGSRYQHSAGVVASRYYASDQD